MGEVPQTWGLMHCDSCGYEEEFSPNITVEGIKTDLAKELMDAKIYFQDAGWKISLGYDLCPNCQ